MVMLRKYKNYKNIMSINNAINKCRCDINIIQTRV